MASDKIIGMMVDKDSPITIEQLRDMTDAECWQWVYANRPPMKLGKILPEICFTGFSPDEKKRMEGIAKDNGYNVVKSVTVKLRFLVTGEAPGPSKLTKAKEQGIQIITTDDFINSLKLMILLNHEQDRSRDLPFNGYEVFTG
jgi:NAD-dependent DNA ligase